MRSSTPSSASPTRLFHSHCVVCVLLQPLLRSSSTQVRSQCSCLFGTGRLRRDIEKLGTRLSFLGSERGGRDELEPSSISSRYVAIASGDGPVALSDIRTVFVARSRSIGRAIILCAYKRRQRGNLSTIIIPNMSQDKAHNEKLSDGV